MICELHDFKCSKPGEWKLLISTRKHLQRYKPTTDLAPIPTHITLDSGIALILKKYGCNISNIVKKT